MGVRERLSAIFPLAFAFIQGTSSEGVVHLRSGMAFHRMQAWRAHCAAERKTDVSRVGLRINPPMLFRRLVLVSLLLPTPFAASRARLSAELGRCRRIYLQNYRTSLAWRRVLSVTTPAPPPLANKRLGTFGRMFPGAREQVSRKTCPRHASTLINFLTRPSSVVRFASPPFLLFSVFVFPCLAGPVGWGGFSGAGPRFVFGGAVLHEPRSNHPDLNRNEPTGQPGGFWGKQKKKKYTKKLNIRAGHLLPRQAQVRRLSAALPGHVPRSDRRPGRPAHRRAQGPLVPHHRAAEGRRPGPRARRGEPRALVRRGQGHGEQRAGGNERPRGDRKPERGLPGACVRAWRGA